MSMVSPSTANGPERERLRPSLWRKRAGVWKSWTWETSSSIFFRRKAVLTTVHAMLRDLYIESEVVKTRLLYGGEETTETRVIWLAGSQKDKTEIGHTELIYARGSCKSTSF